MDRLFLFIDDANPLLIKRALKLLDLTLIAGDHLRGEDREVAALKAHLRV